MLLTNTYTSQVLEGNHKVIYSASWYLDYLATGGDWGKFYTVDPRQMIPRHYKELNLNNILGGEACMWGESVDDRNLISRYVNSNSMIQFEAKGLRCTAVCCASCWKLSTF